MGFVDCLKLFFADPDTDCVVLLGEIGGRDEEEAAAFLAANPTPKPVVAYVAGLHAPTERRMGHAGTVNVFGPGDAAGKIAGRSVESGKSVSVRVERRGGRQRK